MLSRRGAILLASQLTAIDDDQEALEKWVSLKRVIDEANTDLVPLGFSVRASRDDTTGKLYYCLVDTGLDDLGKSTRSREEWQAALFNYALERICEVKDG